MNIKIIRCTERYVNIVDDILKDPSVYEYIIDDGSLSVELYTSKELISNPLNYVLLVNYTSVVIFTPLFYGTYITHAASLPVSRGKKMVKYTKEAFNWMFRNTNCMKIICMVPFYNYRAKVLSKNVGCVEEGIIKKGFLKDSKLYDLYVYGISKKEVV